MIEAIMYSAIGFLTATLLALLLLPAVWRRAVRLTRKRIEGAIPVSIAEIQADKDEQRAIFAVGIRRLEMEVEKLQARAAAQYGDLVRQTETLRARQETIERLSTELDALRTEHGTVATHRDHLLGELDTRTRDLEQTAATLRTTRAELAKTRDAFEDTRTREEELKIDHVALTTLRDTLKDRIGELDRHLAAANAHLQSERETLRTTAESLSIELRRNRELKDELARAEARLDEEASALKAERAALTTELAQLEARAHAAEKARRQAEALRVVAPAPEAARAIEPPAPGRAEAPDTVRLRERISDIAAEVAHLTSRLEGPDSPIEALLAAHSATPGAAPTLADRILALRAAPEDGPQDRPEQEPEPAPVDDRAAEEPRPKGRAIAG
ncbi:hypothetical protein KHC23_08180 [Ancylobacter dichloromethanicus]|nr:hypothetical protein [Ancylobacter dichloromethanicus]MBS7553625.1 hypothetical protein [Ancylobacter dichloromethanicus]